MNILPPELLIEWQALRDDVKGRNNLGMANLFFGHKPELFDRGILYIGKATKGDFEDDVNGKPAAERFFNGGRGGFWPFARAMCRDLGLDSENLSDVYWGNLCRLGVLSGNPGSDLSECQRPLAVRTLRHEITVLQPRLIVCTAEGYNENFLYEALELVQDGDDGFVVESIAGSEFWVRPKVDHRPAVVWMKHPQGKKREYLLAARQIAVRLWLDKNNL